jgi:hypothetical protein
MAMVAFANRARLPWLAFAVALALATPAAALSPAVHARITKFTIAGSASAGIIGHRPTARSGPRPHRTLRDLEARVRTSVTHQARRLHIVRRHVPRQLTSGHGAVVPEPRDADSDDLAPRDTSPVLGTAVLLSPRGRAPTPRHRLILAAPPAAHVRPHTPRGPPRRTLFS